MNQVEELVKVVAEAQTDKGNVVIVELKQWEMEAIVLEKNRARNRARILAGYC